MKNPIPLRIVLLVLLVLTHFQAIASDATQAAPVDPVDAAVAAEAANTASATAVAGAAPSASVPSSSSTGAVVATYFLSDQVLFQRYSALITDNRVHIQSLAGATGSLGTNAMSNIENAVYLRAAGEMSYAAFLELQSDVNPMLRDAFLHNCEAVMQTVDSQPGSQVASMLATAARNDAKAFPDNIRGYLYAHPPTDKNLLMISLLIQAAIPAKDDPVVALARLVKIRDLKIVNGKVEGDEKLRQSALVAVYTIGVAAQAYELYKAAGNSTDTLSDNIGTMAKRVVKIVVDAMDDNALVQSNRKMLEDDVIILIQRIDDLSKLAQGVKDPAVNPSKVFDDAFAKRLISAIDETFSSLTTITVEFTSKSSPTGTRVNQALYDIKNLVEGGINCYRAWIDKDYKSVVGNIVIAMNSIFSLIESSEQAPAKVETEKIKAKVVTILKWSDVLAGLATAKTPQDFDGVLDSVSDPISSYRKYRVNSGIYLSLKGYIGGAVGREAVRANQNASSRPGIYSGLFLPVGAEFGWSTGSYISYVGIMASPVDLGAITATRFDSRTSTHNVTLNDVIAPGAFLTVGISHNWPITAGFGYQYIPYQRHDPTTGASLVANREMAFVAIDVPFMGWKY